MICARDRYRIDWYTAVKLHGQQSPEAIVAREAYIAHRKSCARCRMEMMTPRVEVLFTIGDVTNSPSSRGNHGNSVTSTVNSIPEAR